MPLTTAGLLVIRGAWLLAFLMGGLSILISFWVGLLLATEALLSKLSSGEIEVSAETPVSAELWSVV